MQFNIMPRMYVWQFTLVLIAKCHSTISWIMSNYFKMQCIISYCRNDELTKMFISLKYENINIFITRQWTSFCWRNNELTDIFIAQEYEIIEQTISIIAALLRPKDTGAINDITIHDWWWNIRCSQTQRTPRNMLHRYVTNMYRYRCTCYTGMWQTCTGTGEHVILMYRSVMSVRRLWQDQDQEQDFRDFARRRPRPKFQDKDFRTQVKTKIKTLW